MNNKIKENILNDFIKMIQASWTYNRMTENEKAKIIETLNHVRTIDALKGTYKQRWNILNAIYGAFLAGIGYDGCTWRETKKDIPF